MGQSPVSRAAAGHEHEHEHAPRTKTKTPASTHSDQPSSHITTTPTFRVHTACCVTVCPSILCWTKHYTYACSTAALRINDSHTVFHSTQSPAHRLQVLSIPSITSRRLSQSRSRSRSTSLVACYGPRRRNTIAGLSSSLLQDFNLQYLVGNTTTRTSDGLHEPRIRVTKYRSCRSSTKRCFQSPQQSWTDQLEQNPVHASTSTARQNMNQSTRPKDSTIPPYSAR
jgi:hypothetical protein